MRKPAVAVNPVNAVMAVVSFVVLLACGSLAPRDVAAQTKREDPPACKEFGPASPRCTEARNAQMKAGLQPRACEKYGAASPQCDKALEKRASKTKAKRAAAASSPAAK